MMELKATTLIVILSLFLHSTFASPIYQTKPLDLETYSQEPFEFQDVNILIVTDAHVSNFVFVFLTQHPVASPFTFIQSNF